MQNSSGENSGEFTVYIAYAYSGKLSRIHQSSNYFSYITSYSLTHEPDCSLYHSNHVSISMKRLPMYTLCSVDLLVIDTTPTSNFKHES